MGRRHSWASFMEGRVALSESDVKKLMADPGDFAVARDRWEITRAIVVCEVCFEHPRNAAEFCPGERAVSGDEGTVPGPSIWTPERG